MFLLILLFSYVRLQLPYFKSLTFILHFNMYIWLRKVHSVLFTYIMEEWDGLLSIFFSSSYLCVQYIIHLTYINYMYFQLCKLVCQMGQVMFVWCHCTNGTSLFIGCLTWIFIPGSHASGSHWIPADMTNTRQHMPSHDWPVTSYIKQNPLLLREKVSVSATTLVERVRYFLVESGYLYKSLGTC